MSNARNPILESVRIIPRDGGFLDRKLGARGEVFFDQEDNTLRLYDGANPGGIPLLRADLENVEGVIGAALGDNPPTGETVRPGTLWFNTSNGRLYVLYSDGTSVQWVQPQTPSFGSGGEGGATTLNGLTDVVISGAQTGQVLKYNGTQWINAADSTEAGTVNIHDLGDVDISAPAAGQVLTYNGTQWQNTTTSSSNAFGTVAVFGQSSVVADSAGDTLTLSAGAGISLTTNATNDTIVITATSSANEFWTLTDAAAASLTVDKFYLPAITKLVVTNNLATAYRFDQYGPGDNPTIYAISGTTIAFDLQAAGHPFQIQDPLGNNYNEGLIHVSSAGVVSTGANAQGKSSGTLYWKIPFTVSGGYRYQCASHVSMVGSISIKGLNAI